MNGNSIPKYRMGKKYFIELDGRKVTMRNGKREEIAVYQCYIKKGQPISLPGILRIII